MSPSFLHLHVDRLATATGARPSYLSGSRDLRIDLLRGMAIFAMVVDHVGGDESWLYPLTGGNRFYVSAAEAFLFLSGVVTGIVYGSVAKRQGLGPAILKMLRRASVLYVWTVGLTLVLPIIAKPLDLAWEDPFQSVPPLAYAISVLTLHRTYHLVDILLVYVLLFILAGLALTLIVEGRTPIVLALSWGAWAAWQAWPQYAAIPWAIEGMDVFNMAPWQALFFTGLVIGAHRQAIGEWLARLRLSAYSLVGGGGLAVGIWLYRHELQAFLVTAPNLDAQKLAGDLFSKADLRVGRLIMFAFVAMLSFSLVTAVWPHVDHWVGWLLVPLGQNSLMAYALHLGIVAGLTKIAMVTFGDDGRGPAQNALLQATGVMMVWLLIEGYLQLGRLQASCGERLGQGLACMRRSQPARVAAGIQPKEPLRDAA